MYNIPILNILTMRCWQEAPVVRVTCHQVLMVDLWDPHGVRKKNLENLKQLTKASQEFTFLLSNLGQGAV